MNAPGFDGRGSVEAKAIQAPAKRWSIAGKLLALLLANAAATAATAVAIVRLGGDWWAVAIGCILVGGSLAIFAAQWGARGMSRTLHALTDGIQSLTHDDFSVSIANRRRDELGQLVTAYNAMSQALRDERQDLFQRELLLDTVIQATPLALVLTNPQETVLYSNLAARQLFNEGRRLEGLNFTALLVRMPVAMREAVARAVDSLFTLERGGEPQVYHLSQRQFLLNTLPHRLLLLKLLTREINAQEISTWKRVIRVIAHELNNSLAPVSSLAHSARQLAANPDPTMLDKVFNTIEDRLRHLNSFIEGYSRFAKLPRPRLAAVQWSLFIDDLRRAYAFELQAPLPGQTAHFDTTQLEQVLINLLKNAHESGSAPAAITLAIDALPGGWQLRVLDRGAGMPDDVLANALLPFYSTKPEGTGLGLTLCREIIEAHGGWLSLANRADGGVAVTIFLPDSMRSGGA
ncbi:MAG TPA: ATP-binding protein [Steroidobacteraceae bacterium]|nr:ATP-binding protein [Steroidobacteraceae bacterium]